MKRAIVFAWLLLCSTLTFALAPEDGIWYNPAQPGRGWVVTSQNDVMAVSTYTYTEGGAPTWYLSVGTYNDSSRRFNGSLVGTSNGQCIGCSYRAPVTTGSAGELQIQFVTADTAMLQQAGETVPIKKYYYAYGGLNDRMYGEWSYAMHVALSVGDSEFLQMTGSYTSPTTGKQYVTLKRKFSTLGSGLVAYDAELNEYIAVLLSSSSYNKAFVFKAENSRILDGRWWLYRTTESISGNGDYMTGQRTAEKNDVNAVSKSSSDDHATIEARDATNYAAMSKGGKALDAKRQSIVDELQWELETSGGLTR